MGEIIMNSKWVERGSYTHDLFDVNKSGIKACWVSVCKYATKKGEWVCSFLVGCKVLTIPL